MADSKIRIKVGSMEVEYEGDPAFLDGGIEKLLVTMADLAGKVPDEPAPPAAPAAAVSGAPAATSGGAYSFSTNTIAAHTSAKSGTELVICAMAHLELVQGKASCVRQEILNEMKNATTYYNENMRKNLGQSLSTLVKNKRINQIAKDTYSLSANERKDLEAKVAEIG